MIRCVLDAGVSIETCYIDTVGMPGAYKAKLDREFAGCGIAFVVEKKADSKYVQCSAASVVAKVARDTIMERWEWTEPGYEPRDGLNFGSGYPSDPKCKEWLSKNLQDGMFCFPDLVRFSWGPAKKAVEEGGIQVEWEADEDEDDEERQNLKGQRKRMQAFLASGGDGDGSDNQTMKLQVGAQKKARLAYFEQNKLQRVTELIKS